MAQLGRPPTGNPRTHVIPVRYTDDEHAKLVAAAETAGLPVSAYIRARSLGQRIPRPR